MSRVHELFGVVNGHQYSLRNRSGPTQRGLETFGQLQPVRLESGLFESLLLDRHPGS